MPVGFVRLAPHGDGLLGVPHANTEPLMDKMFKKIKRELYDLNNIYWLVMRYPLKG
jgi:hypothetical protein